VFTLEVILLAFVLGETLTFVKNNALYDMEQRQKVIIKLVTSIATDALFSEEYDDLQRQINLISDDVEVNFISVTNLDDVILANSDFSLVGSKNNYLPTDPHTKFSVIENFGNIIIRFSSVQLESRIKKARNLGIYIAVSGILIIACASILFGYFLTSKLRKLNLAMQQFQDGNQLVNVDIKGRDEVSELANQFTFLTKKVNKHIKLLEDEKTLLESRVTERTQELQQLNSELEVLATTDYLTSLKNRGFVEEALHTELVRYLRNNLHTFSVILLDVDYFKSINDTHGHDAGDMILIDIANLLTKNTRDTDIVGRWGGEEFIILCVDTNISSCKTIAEKLRIIIDEYKFPHVNHLTCSFGVSTSVLSDNVNSILKRADLGLYKAKDQGRNNVFCLTDS
jgi:diguanylate cyclase (GGDEF)-like protein